jgi:hypothetical protein
MSPFPMTAIPTLPPVGPSCLWQLHKQAEGERRTALPAPHPCDTGPVQQGTGTIRLKLVTAGPPCDQDPGLIPNGCVLEARGILLRRADGMADFTGRFVITSPAGVAMFRGAIELMDRIGTHHAPFGPEPCNPESHIEGWLVGLGGPTLPNHCLRALFVARGQLGQGPGPFAVLGSLDGVLVKTP